MKTFICTLILSFISIQSYSQNLDSLYNLINKKQNVSQGVEEIPSQIENSQNPNYEIEKCSFGLHGAIKENFDKFTLDQQNVLRKIMSRPVMDTSIISPSGRFRIHYDKSGNNTPNYSGIDVPTGSDPIKIMVDSIAAAFDYSYEYEINKLGYIAPPSDGTEGGDDKYDVYIRNLGSRLYGETIFGDDLPNDRVLSYIQIENDFIGNFNSEGILAARVTAAHEYHHAIQVGSYIFRGSDTFYYELTSTAMEEFVFDDVNDYYINMNKYFTNTTRSLSEVDGYDSAIWNIFLRDRFGADIIKRTWELMVNTRAIKSISDAIFENNSTFKFELNEFAKWTYFTNYRTIPFKYFEEAKNYPLVKPIMSDRLTNSSLSLTVNSKPVSNNFIEFIIPSGNAEDTLVTYVSNSDVNNGVDNTNSTTQFVYSLYNSSQDGSTNIINQLYYKLTSDNEGLIKTGHSFNNTPVEGTTSIIEGGYVFPQPFNYSNSNHDNLYIPTNANQISEADLNIYTVAMNLVYSGIHQIRALNGLKSIASDNNAVVAWNGLDNNNAKLPTGVYIYVTNSYDSVKKGKLVIYNE